MYICMYLSLSLYRYIYIYIYIELVSHTPCIPVSMSVSGFKAGGMMNLHAEDGVSERTQH